MAHIIEILRNTEAEARSFLDGLFYSDSVSAIGHRADGENTRAIAVNWDADQETPLDGQISNIIKNTIETGEDLDEIEAYCQIFPETVHYQGETS